MHRLHRVAYYFHHLLPRQYFRKFSLRCWKRPTRCSIAAITLSALLCTTQLPTLASLTYISHNSTKQSTQQSEPVELVLNKQASSAAFLPQGQILYQKGELEQAIIVLNDAIAHYRRTGNLLAQAISLGNLSLVYQNLGQWPEATQAIKNSFGILSQTKADDRTRASLLDIRANLQLEVGQVKKAIKSWEISEQYYHKINDIDNILSSRINQAQALRVLGFYGRSLELLQETSILLQDEPISPAKATHFRLLGNALSRSEPADKKIKPSLSELLLGQSWAIAEALQNNNLISSAYLSLGNMERRQENWDAALNYYEEAGDFASNITEQLQIQSNSLSVLLISQQWQQANKKWKEWHRQLSDLPSSHDNLSIQVYIIQNFLQADLKALKLPLTSFIPILTNAISDAELLGDQLALSQALGALGHLYEKANRYPDAIAATEHALQAVQSINVPHITYALSWQLGRVLGKQEQTLAAVSAYEVAISDLASLRQDLVAEHQDLQFSFKESVEPIYRESVSLLLKAERRGLSIASNNTKINPKNTQANKQEDSLDKNLEMARQHIEALQLAELDDYFREACIDGQVTSLDQVVDKDNPKTAIIYPILLEDELAVIVKMPGQKLKYYGKTTKVERENIEQSLTQLQACLQRKTKLNKIKKESSKIYQWLISPIEEQLEKSDVNTLVFILDGALRNIPMSVLYDGDRDEYLIEKYGLAVNLGLQLQVPKSISETKLAILAAGLVEQPHFPKLSWIIDEFKLISSTSIESQQLLDSEFTSERLSEMIQTKKFNILHLATHAKFSSNPEDTFILASDGPIQVEQLDKLLRNRISENTQPIELLVLSACQTAKGDNRAILGLAGIAVKAGARSTLASLWPVKDNFTAELMGVFYQKLAEGKFTKAEALQQAQVSLLQDKNSRHPASWAPYILVGNWL